MKVAIIGTGISGLTCARRLATDHEVTVFEARARIGGHTNTVSVTVADQQYAVDTGFIVYNERTYPNFTQLLNELQVDTEPTSMSFSVRCDRTGLEYNGTNLNGVFAQRRNLIRPSFLRLLNDILRFNRRGPNDVHTVPRHQTVGQYLDEHGFSDQFARQYLLPMGAAIWSCPSKTFADFPIHFILEFYHNHGLLALRNRPVWRVIRGGSKNYLPSLIAPFKDRIRTSCPVQSVRRFKDGVEVSFEGGKETFDEVVLPATAIRHCDCWQIRTQKKSVCCQRFHGVATRPSCILMNLYCQHGVARGPHGTIESDAKTRHVPQLHIT